MVYGIRPLGKVKELGEVFQVCAPLHEQLLALRRVEIRTLAAPEQVAQIRLSGLSNDFSRTSFAPIKANGEPTILYKDSPLMNPLVAVIAVNAHKSGEYPLFLREVYEAVKEIAKSQEGLAPEDRDAHILQGNPDNEGKFQLTPEMDDTRFILRKLTREYFKKFNHTAVPFYDIVVDLPKNKSIVNYLGFDRPGYGSVLGAGGRSGDLRAFGVLVSAEGTQKNSGYTLTNFNNAIAIATPETLKGLGLSGLEDALAEPLRKGILEAVRQG